MLIAAALLCGFVFGWGLLISGMIQPAKVLAFLDILGAWDPSLAVVMVAALVVSTLGLSGVLAQLVIQRRREIGVRVALGAQSSDVVRWVFKNGLVPALAGLAVGIAIFLAGSRFVRSLLFEVSPSDPLSLTGVCLLLLALAALASLGPAWRAMRVDPVSVLRE